MPTSLILYFADKKINEFMRACDLCTPGKVYTTPHKVTFTTSSVVDETYCRALMDKSKSQETFWIAAVRHNGFLYIDPAVRQLSDGQLVYWVHGAVEQAVEQGMF